jgi:short subunit dehydrogenase-like uncharacterized protein
VTPVTIVLYGATGYTGRLVARELARRELDHVLSGRSAEKLAALGGNTRAVPLDDDAALRELLEPARVVINCAGPFTLAIRPPPSAPASRWCPRSGSTTPRATASRA